MILIVSVKLLGAKNLAAAAAIQRNADLHEEAKSRDFAALPTARCVLLLNFIKLTIRVNLHELLSILVVMRNCINFFLQGRDTCRNSP